MNIEFKVEETSSSSPIIYNEEKCIGCNRCVDICQVDVLLPNEAKGKSPVVQYVGECWFCGCCVMQCPVDGAIKLRHPLMNQVHWVEKNKLIEGDK